MCFFWKRKNFFLDPDCNRMFFFSQDIGFFAFLNGFSRSLARFFFALSNYLFSFFASAIFLSFIQHASCFVLIQNFFVSFAQKASVSSTKNIGCLSFHRWLSRCFLPLFPSAVSFRRLLPLPPVRCLEGQKKKSREFTPF